MSKKVVFKTYDPNQLKLIPPSFEELIPANHPVRVVNDIIDHINLEALERSYKGGGASSYHPRMLLKVLIYAYLRNLYSSRKIEEALHESVHFMWISGGSKPDHNTINDFRGKRLGGHLKEIFTRVVMLLNQQGHLCLKQVYLDGTKIQANANRYSFVWGKSIRASRERMQQQLKALWKYVEQVYKEEQQQPNPPNFQAVDPKQMAQTIDEINQALKGKAVDKKIRRKLQYARKNWPGRLEKYQQQDQQLAGRNSMSKTDVDATFMRMKEDHRGKGQPKPGYNLQASTNKQFILNYTLEQTPGDSTTLIKHVDQHIEAYGEPPDQLTADAGYGSQENYTYLEGKAIEAFVKYNRFDREQRARRQGKDDPFDGDSFYYNEQTHTCYCPMGQAMQEIESGEQNTSTGFVQHYKRYKARNCKGCGLVSLCSKTGEDRVIRRNEKLLKIREKVSQRLNTQQGIEQRKRRCYEVEPVFGNIKHNMNFRRFLLRGLKKVEVEIGLIAMAHNLKKLSLAF